MSVAFDSNVTLYVEVSFDAPSVTSPTWTDLTAKAKNISIKRGRSYELDDIPAGSCTVTFDNRDRMLDPSYSGAYSGLLPMARLRIRAKQASSSTVYSMFYGYIASWPTQYDPPNNAITTVTAYDALSVLALDPLASNPLDIGIDSLQPDGWWKFDDDDGSATILDYSGNDFHGNYGSQATITYQQDPIPPGANSEGKSVALAQSFGSLSLTDSMICRLPQYADIMRSGKWTFGCAFTTSSSASDQYVWSRAIPGDTTGAPYGYTYLKINTSSNTAEFGRAYAIDLTSLPPLVSTITGAITNAQIGVSTNRFFAVAWWDPTTLVGALRLVAVNTGGVTVLDTTTSFTAPFVSTLIDDEGACPVWIGADRRGLGTTSAYPLVGKVDEFTYWTRVLTSTERTMLLESYKQTWPNEPSGTRVDRVLDRIGWQSSLRSIDTGQSTVVMGATAGDALSYLKKVAASEGGLLYASTDGAIVYKDRNSILLNGTDAKVKLAFSDASSTSGTTTYNASATYNDATVYYQGSLRYEDIQDAGYDDRLIWNQVEVTYAPNTSTAGTATARDKSTYDRYRWRKQSVDTLLANRADAFSQAKYRLGRYSSPKVRIASIKFDPRVSPADGYLAALTLDIGDAVDVVRTPLVGTAKEIRSNVEGVNIDISISPRNWKVNLTLSPTDTTPYMIWDDAVRGYWDIFRWGP